jgi:hypothetical protein
MVIDLAVSQERCRPDAAGRERLVSGQATVMSETSHCIEGVERHGSPESMSVAHGLWKVGIASSKAVVAWADTMIVRCDAVPMELVELPLLPLRARVELRL